MRRKGIGTILGATFFIIIVLLAFGTFMALASRFDVYRGVVSEMEQLDWEKLNERLDIVSIKLHGINHVLNLTITNTGAFTAHLVQLWVINYTANEHKYVALDIYIPPGATLVNVAYSSPSVWLKPSGGPYAIRVVTERGNIFSVHWPLERPPFIGGATFSNGTLNVLPGVFEKIDKCDVKDPYKGDGDFFVKVQNPVAGPVGLVVNFLSRAIFVDVSSGRVYSAYIINWFSPAACKGAEISHSQEKEDSAIVRVGDYMIFGFTEPESLEPPTKPPPPAKIPAGTYNVYFIFQGYDENGAFYVQTFIVADTVTLTK